MLKESLAASGVGDVRPNLGVFLCVFKISPKSSGFLVVFKQKTTQKHHIWGGSCWLRELDSLWWSSSILLLLAHGAWSSLVDRLCH